MSTVNIGSIASKVFDIVCELEQSEQIKVLKAVYALCDIAPLPNVRVSENGKSPDATTADSNFTDPASYLAHKAPQSKIEHLAVAARYMEEHDKKSEYTKEDFIAFFSSARKNFDHSNFPFDMRNAKNAGFFVKESSKTHAHRLTYNGQNYVDSLPDTAKAISQIKKPNSKKKK